MRTTPVRAAIVGRPPPARRIIAQQSTGEQRRIVDREHSTGRSRDQPVDDEDGLGFYAIMFTDMVLSTGLRSRLGDEPADEVHHEVGALSGQVVVEHHGTVVKGTGDGLLAIFRGPSDALKAGVDIQRRMGRRNRGADVPVHLRVGITAGEVSVTGGDVYGIHVNEAARLCAAAGAGTVLVDGTMVAMSRHTSVEFGPPVEVVITPGSPAIHAYPVDVDLGGEPLTPIPRALDPADDGVQFVGPERRAGHAARGVGARPAGRRRVRRPHRRPRDRQDHIARAVGARRPPSSRGSSSTGGATSVRPPPTSRSSRDSST